MMKMALTGYNGDNETHIGSSKSFGYSLFDKNTKEISVKRQENSIVFTIAKDTSVLIEPFELIDVMQKNSTNFTNETLYSNGFINRKVQLNGLNVSLHIQIKPNNTQSVGYLTLIKFGNTASAQNYDFKNIFCPNDLIEEGNDLFYLIFANITTVNAFKGYVSLAIKEIDSISSNCTKIKETNSLIDNVSNNFTNNFWLRIYASGCYFMDPLTSVWSSYGMEILSNTNQTHTHCLSNHLTSFAGGFLVLPNSIDFNNVWANASFLKNPVIYSTVIALVTIYILLAIWARYSDSKDNQKFGITLLADLNQVKNTENKYIYEIIVFTGNRLNAGTKSKVIYLLNSLKQKKRFFCFNLVFN